MTFLFTKDNREAGRARWVGVEGKHEESLRSESKVCMGEGEGGQDGDTTGTDGAVLRKSMRMHEHIYTCLCVCMRVL